MDVKGGAKWRSGADTCVFKPAVRCEGETERRPGVSRVLNVNTSKRDVEVETRIANEFPRLAETGKVTVYTNQCTPQYEEADIESAESFIERKGCTKLGNISPGINRNHTNLITEEREGTVAEYFKCSQENPPKWRTVIADALRAAMTMVPDNGPWIIHADCHLGNVLYAQGWDKNIHSSLADWGRTLIIENPKNLESVRNGIREWITTWKKIDKATTSDRQIVEHMFTLPGEEDEYKQHPRAIVYPVARLLHPSTTESSPDFANAMNVIRGWVPYVIIGQTLEYVPSQSFDHRIITHSRLSNLLQTGSQADLIRAVNKLLEPPQRGGMYWPLKYHRGLSTRKNLERKKDATRRAKMSWKNPRAYTRFTTDKGVKTRRSSYTSKFHKKYPGVKTLPEIAKATGIPKKVLEEVYNRGMAAWRTGHRPGASQHAWGMARVHSFVLHGKTWRTADKDLAEK